jgi:hypothetical protein
MQIRRRWIEARLYTQGSRLREFFYQFGFYEQLIGSALDDSQGFLLR